MLIQTEHEPGTESRSVGTDAASASDTAPEIAEPIGRRSKWQDVRDRALADPSCWHRTAVLDDPDAARRLRSRIRRGIARWGPAGTFDARTRLDERTGAHVVWIRSLGDREATS